MDDHDLFLKVIEANKGKKVCPHDTSTPTMCTTPILLPVIHMMKLEAKFKDR